MFWQRCGLFLTIAAVAAMAQEPGQYANAQIPVYKKYDLHVVVEEGPYAGVEGSGWFQFDVNKLDTGEEFGDEDPDSFYAHPYKHEGIGAGDPCLTLSLTILGQDFSEMNDEFFPIWSQLFLHVPTGSTGVYEPLVLDFLIAEEGSKTYPSPYNPTEIDEPGVLSIYLGRSGLVADGNGGYTTVAEIEAIPEPSTITLWFVAGVVGIGWWARRKRTAA